MPVYTCCKIAPVLRKTTSTVTALCSHKIASYDLCRSFAVHFLTPELSCRIYIYIGYILAIHYSSFTYCRCVYNHYTCSAYFISLTVIICSTHPWSYQYELTACLRFCNLSYVYYIVDHISHSRTLVHTVISYYSVYYVHAYTNMAFKLPGEYVIIVYDPSWSIWYLNCMNWTRFSCVIFGWSCLVYSNKCRSANLHHKGMRYSV